MMKLEEEIEKLGYKITKTVGNSISVRALHENRKEEIEKLNDVLGGDIDRTPAAIRASSVGRIKIDGRVLYLKPGDKNSGAKETMNIQSITMIQKGKKSKTNWSGIEFESIEFDCPYVLHESINYGLEQNKNVGPNVSIFVDDLFSEKKFASFEWPDTITICEKRQLAKYLGELIIGFNALDGDTSTIVNSPIKKANLFSIPVDPTFAGIDSIVDSGETQYPISSKFGLGANASFFTNILPKALQSKNMESCVLNDICDVCRGNSFSPKDAKRILYEFGIKNILKLTSITDTFSIYETLRKQETSHDVELVIEKIKSTSNNKEIIDKLPTSIGGFFSRTIADMLNGDPVSIRIMKEILAGKGFWQANLSENDWYKGKTIYNMIEVSDIVLTLYGNKSTLSDVTMKQGLINYSIRSAE